MNIELTFLGTSNAFPTKQRNHPALLLSWGPERILFDCGEGTQRQFRIAELNPCKLTRIALTHLHGDHVLGLPGLLETLHMSEYAKTIALYGPIGTRRHIEALENVYGSFNLKKTITELKEKPLEEEDWHLEVEPMEHGTPTNAYAFVIKEKRRIDKTKLNKLKLPNSPLLKDLQQGKDIIFNNKKYKAKDLTYMQPGKKVAIIMDTMINERAIKLAKGADCLVCEATYAAEESDYAKEHKHLTIEQAATIAKKAKVKQLILTHISHRYEFQLDKLEKQGKKIFKNLRIAKDFDKFTI